MHIDSTLDEFVTIPSCWVLWRIEGLTGYCPLMVQISCGFVCVSALLYLPSFIFVPRSFSSTSLSGRCLEKLLVLALPVRFTRAPDLTRDQVPGPDPEHMHTAEIQLLAWGVDGLVL